MEQTSNVSLEKWRQVSKEHFSKITPHYDQGRAFEQGQPPVEEIQRHTPVGEADWVLDVGTGTGLFAAHFARQMAGRVAGIDPARSMLRQALHKERTDKLNWLQGLAESLPFADGTLRVVFLSQVWHHLSVQERSGHEFFRCLKPGGGLYIKTYSHAQLKARWDLLEIFPELMPFMLSIYPDVPEMTAMLEGIGFAPVTSKSTFKEGFMRPSQMLTLMREKAWSMFSFLSPEGAAEGEARLESLAASGDQPVFYPEVHLLVVARR
ncbi:MAG: class I SAM-dependent methyltransferase [Chloroflexi bacterium]|nr:class I SAM-dependent methyltransferase [Chloroflexota bacterium]